MGAYAQPYGTSRSLVCSRGSRKSRFMTPRQIFDNHGPWILSQCVSQNTHGLWYMPPTIAHQVGRQRNPPELYIRLGRHIGGDAHRYSEQQDRWNFGSSPGRQEEDCCYVGRPGQGRQGCDQAKICLDYFTIDRRSQQHNGIRFASTSSASFRSRWRDAVEDPSSA